MAKKQGRSKSDMVREAIRAGVTETGAVTEWVKQKYGVNVPHSLVPPLRKELAGWEVMTPAPVTAVPLTPPGPAGVDVEAVRLVREAVRRVGADSVKDLADLFGQ